MPEAIQMARPTPYASNDDFCTIFHEETDSLFRLSLLLTADCDTAQQCFVSGLEDSLKASRVFKEWARSWARRAIIQNAVRVINPRPMGGNSPSSFNSSSKTLVAEPAEIGAILELAPFERFVFVISVLEDYSEHECSVLLGCSRRDVTAARTRALQQIGNAMELHVNQQVNVGSGKPALDDDCRAVLELQLAPYLATSA
jgi:DNA-directed RNA polymerase specialized sigma24 family protein